MTTTKKTPPSKENMRAPPDGWGDNLDGIAIAENNAHQRRGHQEDDRIGLWCGGRTTTMTTTMTITKGADDHDKEDPSEGGEYARRAKTRRRDQHLPRRYVARPSRLMMATQCSCSWQRQLLQPRLHKSSSLGAGTTTIIPGLLLPQRCPRQQ